MSQKGIFSTISNIIAPNTSLKNINDHGAIEVEQINHQASNHQTAEGIYKKDQDQQQLIHSYNQNDFDSQFKHILKGKHNDKLSKSYKEHLKNSSLQPNLQRTESSQISSIRDKLNEIELDNHEINLPQIDSLNEKSKSTPQRINNQSIQQQKKPYHDQQFLSTIKSQKTKSNIFATDFKQDSEQMKDNQINLPQQTSLVKSISSKEDNSQLATDQTGLVTQSQLDKMNINSIDEYTSCLSTPIPLIKKKKSIQKNISPQQTSSHYNAQKGSIKGNKKRTPNINTSILSQSIKKDSNNQTQNNSQNNTSKDQNEKMKNKVNFENSNFEDSKNRSTFKNIDSSNSTNNNLGDINLQKQSNSQENQSKKIRFTPEEDEALMNLISIHGKKWRVISELMNGKNETRIRNRYYSYIRKLQKPANNQQNQIDYLKDSTEEENFDQIECGMEENINNQNQNKSQNPDSYQNNNNRFEIDISNKNQSNKKDSLNYQSEFKNNNNHQNKTNHNFNNQNQQSTRTAHFFNSNHFDSLNVLTLNNFEKDFNGVSYEANNFQTNCNNSLLVQSNNHLQYQFSQNNLNYENNNTVQENKIPSFKYFNTLEGSLVNLDFKVENQYLNNKNKIEFEAIDAEEFNQKYNQDDNICFSSVIALHDDQQIIPESQQNSYKQIQSQQYNNIQTFCPNKILKSASDQVNEMASPLIFAKVQKGYDAKRFLTSNIQQMINSQNPISRYSMDEELTDDNMNEQSKTDNEYNDSCYRSMSELEKMQKINFLNNQVENISTMIEQCKQEILKEIISKTKKFN